MLTFYERVILLNREEISAFALARQMPSFCTRGHRCVSLCGASGRKAVARVLASHEIDLRLLHSTGDDRYRLSSLPLRDRYGTVMGAARVTLRAASCLRALVLGLVRYDTRGARDSICHTVTGAQHSSFMRLASGPARTPHIMACAKKCRCGASAERRSPILLRRRCGAAL